MAKKQTETVYKIVEARRWKRQPARCATCASPK